MKTNKEMIQVKKTNEGWSVIVACEFKFTTNKEALHCCNRAVNFIEPFENEKVVEKRKIVIEEIQFPDDPQEEAKITKAKPSKKKKPIPKDLSEEEQELLKTFRRDSEE